MFCLYSKSSEYALRALIQMTYEGTVSKFKAEEVCRRAGIPEAYSRKTFQSLVSRGFLNAVPGPGGGYSLVTDPAVTTLLDVILAVEGKDNFSNCILGLPVCSDRSPCSVHKLWVPVKSRMVEVLGAQTLAQTAASLHKSKKKRKELRREG